MISLDTTSAFRALSGQAGRLADEYQRLSDAVDSAQARFEEAVNRLGVPVIAADLEHYADETARLEIELAEEAADLAAAKRGLEILERDLTLAWKGDLEKTPKDPSTGRANKDHTEAVLAQYLDAHPEAVALRNEVHDREHNVAMLRAELEGVRARFSATRHRARLTASMLVFMSEPARSLGQMQTVLADNNRTEWREEV